VQLIGVLDQHLRFLREAQTAALSAERLSDRRRAQKALPPRLAFRALDRDIGWWKIGGGRAPRQPGQVRKEAAVTSFRSGRCPVFHFSHRASAAV
jgi:hypothetical protein